METCEVAIPGGEADRDTRVNTHVGSLLQVELGSLLKVGRKLLLLGFCPIRVKVEQDLLKVLEHVMVAFACSAR
jgi:hypothetical protein